MLEPDNDDGPEWTPARGLLTAALVGSLAAAVLVVLTGVLAHNAPVLSTDIFPRGVLAFLIGWVMFSVVHRGAGMVGWPCSVLAFVLAAAVLVSHHAVFAIFETTVPVGDKVGEPSAGWDYYFSGKVMGLTNISALAGLALASLLRHNDDEGGLGTILSFLRPGG